MIDLNLELKSRLKKSTHATVSNLRLKEPSSGVNTDQASDCANLIKNLSNLKNDASKLALADSVTSTSEEESSGGREISNIIKGSELAKRKRTLQG